MPELHALIHRLPEGDRRLRSSANDGRNRRQRERARSKNAVPAPLPVQPTPLRVSQQCGCLQNDTKCADICALPKWAVATCPTG